MVDKTSFIGAVMKIIACTPNKNFDNNLYEQQVIEPVRQLRKLSEELGDNQPTIEQMSWAYHVLNNILIAKKLDEDERIDRLKELRNQYNINIV